MPGRFNRPIGMTSRGDAKLREVRLSMACCLRVPIFALLSVVAFGASACDDDAALKTTARASACDRAAEARLAAPTLGDDEVAGQLRRLTDELDAMVADAETSDVADLETSAQEAATAGQGLVVRVDDRDRFATKRSELLAALDEVDRVCAR
jgi:hypothetical protein